MENAVYHIEHDEEWGSEHLQWLSLLIAPGSSLGGARPKASVCDEHHLWIAKFPSQHDTYDMGAWEFVAYQLALEAGVIMPPLPVETAVSTWRVKASAIGISRLEQAQMAPAFAIKP